jgi:hypothetical protein
LFEPSGVSDDKVDVETIERFAAVDPQLDTRQTIFPDFDQPLAASLTNL